jgi:enoyl-CoA hydratase/carnithine racemase
MSQEYETLEIERDGTVLRVWLARPERRNAITPKMLDEITELFRSLERDFETRVVVLGGRGPTFCAGMDRRAGPAEGREPSERERRYDAQIGRRACRAIEECEVPTVARVQGHAVGGGFCFALACDFRVATRDACFRLPEVELGLPLSWAAIPRLLHEVGAARARELLLLCEDMKAEDGERFGLVHRAVPEEQLDTTVDGIVASLVARPELAVHMTNTTLRGYARLAALGDASEADGDLVGVALRGAAFRERFRLGDD